MKLFNKNHYPVVDDDARFDFFCAIPSEDTFVIDIRRHSIKIEPTTKHGGVTLLDITDAEKQKFYDILIKVDDIRLLGEKIMMLVSMSDKQLMLHEIKVNDELPKRSVRNTVCTQCNMVDSAVAYNKTLMEFLRTTKLSSYKYEAVECKTTKSYEFDLLDVAKYSKKLQDSITINYESPEEKKKPDNGTFTITFSEDFDNSDSIFDSDLEIRAISDLRRIFRSWWL